jgi:hypothetical protein
VPRTFAEKILLSHTDDVSPGEIEVDGERSATEPIPPFVADMIPWGRERLAGRAEIGRA